MSKKPTTLPGYPPFSRLPEHQGEYRAMCERVRGCRTLREARRLAREEIARMRSWVQEQGHGAEPVATPFWEVVAEHSPVLDGKLLAEIAAHPSALGLLLRLAERGERPEFTPALRERLECHLVERMARHPGRVLLVERDEEALLLLLATGGLRGESPAVLHLLRLAHLPFPSLRVHDARLSAHKLLSRVPDLAVEHLLEVLSTGPHPNEVAAIARHPNADERIWRYIAERYPQAPLYFRIFLTIPRAQALPEVMHYLRETAEREPQYFGGLLPLLEGEEFSRAVDRLIGHSPRLAAEALFQLPPSPRRRVSQASLARLLGSLEGETRLRAIGSLQHAKAADEEQPASLASPAAAPAASPQGGRR